MLFVLLFATSCATKKKTVETFFHAITDSIVAHESVKTATVTFIDTTRLEQGRVTYTTIEFFATDSVEGVADTHATLDDIGAFARVKSIQQTTIEVSRESKGEVVERVSVQEERQDVQVATSATTATKEKTMTRRAWVAIASIIGCIIIATYCQDRSATLLPPCSALVA